MNRTSVFLAAILAAVPCFSGNLLAYSGGTGEPNNPYQIVNVLDFNQLSATPTDWNKSFILTANINLTGLTFTRAPIAPDTSTSSGFQGTQFTGIFDGNGHVISNLTITASTQAFIGLFGYVGSGSQIRNLGIENVNVTGGGVFVGGLVGFTWYCTFTSCYATGSVSGSYEVGGLVGTTWDGMFTSCYATGSVSGTDLVGGLVGNNDSSTLTSCYATGSVSGTGWDVGGLVGNNDSSTLTSCYATGSVSGGTDVGGLVGYNIYCTLTSCYATGSVSGTGWDVGGLAGESWDNSLTSCYATGSVTGTSSVGGLVGIGDDSLTSCYATGSVTGTVYVGGLVGFNYEGPLTGCYATGSVTGTSSVGGLVGKNYGSLTSCFWDIQTSGTSDGVGDIDPDPAGAMGKTTIQMKTLSTFIDAGWDFSTTDGDPADWKMYSGDYPRLIWETLSGPMGTPPSVNYFLGVLAHILGYSNDPVNTATGNFIHEETDLSIASRGMPLEFKRFYNSKETRTSSLGLGWTHSYNIFLKEESSTLVSVCWGDGHTDYWDKHDSNYDPNTAGLYDKLVKNGDGTWTVKKKNLDVYNFNTIGRLSAIVDKNGNTIALSYGLADPNLATAIADQAGRTLSLSYTGTLLTSVTDFDSPARAIQYEYDAEHLWRVTDVNSNTITYTYDPNGLTSITDQRGVTTVTNQYDSQGRVIKQWDGNNKLSQFAYDTPQTSITDPNGKVAIHTHFGGYKLLYSIQDPCGYTIYYTYDANCNRTSITDRNGRQTVFAYDARGNVISKMDPNDPDDANDGGITIIEYNDVNFPDLPTKKIDALDYNTQWIYDANGNVKKQIDPNGSQRLWAYNSFGQKLTEVDEANNVTIYTYDTAGRLTQVTDPNGNNTWYGYDDLWRLTKVTDGRGTGLNDPNYTITTAYDKFDRIISIQGPITSQSYQYDKVGNKISTTNGRNYTTTYQYDNSSNLRKIIRPAPDGQSQIIEYIYDELNRKTQQIAPDGNFTAFTYDALGRLLKEKNAEGNETSYTYDPQGNVFSVTDGNGVKTSYKYDWLNRKIEQYDQLGNHWYWRYDKLGRLIQYTDACGKITRYGYDSLGRLSDVNDAANKITRYTYDALGRLTDVNDANGIIVARKFYDTASRLVKQEDALGNAYEYRYDGAGNIISRIDPQNRTTTYIYDNQNRLKETHYPDSNQVVNGYDNNGNLTSSTDSNGTTSFVYDELDRLTSSTDCFNKQVLYGYDLTGNRTSITYPADSNNPARTVTYTYDKANRLDKIKDWANRTWDYTVDGAGRTTQLVYPNGVKEQINYDVAGRLTRLVYKNSTEANLISYAYTRDGQGNPTDINESGTLAPSFNLPVKEDYTYDEDNRLEETTRPATYGYDDNGNMTNRVMGGIATTFTYDFENRLISQTTGASVVRHIYDGQGNRIARSNNGAVTRYVLDRGRSMSHVLCETDASGNITAYYIQGPQIVGRIAADGSPRYYHTDHIGTVVALSDSNQTITDRYAYTPFGITAGKQGATANPFTYVGGLGVMADSDGLYFMRARFYETQTGRFLSKDPVEGALTAPQGLHRYIYVSDNPLINLDPSGLVDVGRVAWGSAEFLGGGIGAGVGFDSGTIAGCLGGVLGVSTAYKGFGDIQYGWHDNPEKSYTLLQDLTALSKEYIIKASGRNPTWQDVQDARNSMSDVEFIAGLVSLFSGSGITGHAGGGGHFQFTWPNGQYMNQNLGWLKESKLLLTAPSKGASWGQKGIELLNFLKELDPQYVSMVIKGNR